MWLRSRIMLFRLFVNMYVYVESVFVCSATNNSVYSLAQSMLGYLGKWTNMWVCSRPLNIPAPAMLPLPSSLGGVNDPYV